MLTHFERLLKKPISIVLIALIGLSLFLLKSVHLQDLSPWLLSLGRLHPLILHFPLVLVMGIFFVELLKLYGGLPFNDRFIFYSFLIAILFSLITIFSGFLLYSTGDFSGILMDNHFKGALFMGASLFICFALFNVYQNDRKYYPVYIISLLVTSLATTFTGHQGASITHGKDYLTEFLPMMKMKGESQASQIDSTKYLYSDIIHPIFESKCVGCHSTTRFKGKLSMSNYADLFKPGASGVMPIERNDTFKSEIFRRISLPDTSDEHMPPAGKTPLDKKEITLVKYFIQTGAFEKLQLKDVPMPEVNILVNQLGPSLKKYKFNQLKEKLTQQELDKELNALAIDLDLTIKKDAESDGNLYSISNKFPPAPFDSKKLKELIPYLEHFSKVSLVSTQLDDADLYFISQMTNVKELYLQKTNIKGPGLIYLSKMTNLEILNISFTATSDKDIIDLLKFPSLKEVYLYQTKTSPDVIKALEKYNPALKIHSEEGPYF